MSHVVDNKPDVFIQEDLAKTYEWLSSLDCLVDVRVEQRDCSLKDFQDYSRGYSQTILFMYGWKYRLLSFLYRINPDLAYEVGLILPWDTRVIMFV